MGKFPQKFGREVVNILKIYYYERGMVGWGRQYRELIWECSRDSGLSPKQMKVSLKVVKCAMYIATYFSSILVLDSERESETTNCKSGSENK